jgi:uncharacterized protein YegP (UPF0339 family)
MRKPKFELCSGKDGKTYFHLKAANGEVVLAGRGFRTKPETIHAIADVMRYGLLENSFVRRESASGQYFFQLKSPAGRILGWSEIYISKQSREVGIASVKNAVQFGRIIDLD